MKSFSSMVLMSIAMTQVILTNYTFIDATLDVVTNITIE